jgi:hypothetical protein
MKFIPGLKLSEYFYNEAVQPLLGANFSKLAYSVARLEWGSDVIGFDTPMSMDHGWGPKLTLFLNESDYEELHSSLDDFFATHLPFEIHGIPTHFGEPLSDGGKIELKEDYPIHHMVTITTPRQFFLDTLGIDITQALTPAIWLTIPQQHLRTVRSGMIYHDGLGTLMKLRQRFHWYPEDIWRYLLANQWQRIDQESPFLGRTGFVGDELGSRLLAGRLITDLMNLTFLIERQYAPYCKWFGSAFQQLSLAPQLTPIFQATLDSQTWETRESHLTHAYLLMVEAYNALKLTEEIPEKVAYFHGRPFLVPPSGAIVDALLESITDPKVKALPQRLGSINQISDNTDLLDELDRCKKLQGLYSSPE